MLQLEEARLIIPLEMDPPLRPVLVTDKAGLDQVKSFLERTLVFGFDLETNVTDDYYTRRIRTIQLGDKQEQYVIDLWAFAGGLESLYDQQGHHGKNLSDDLRAIRNMLKPFLEDRQWTKVGQGLQFEYEMMQWNFGIRCTGFYDTLLAEKNIWAGWVHFMAKGFWGLEDLVKRYCNLLLPPEETGKTFWFEGPLDQVRIDYTGLDVRLPLGVRMGQLRIIEKEELTWACQIEFDAISPFGDMHIAGIYLDPAPWRVLLADKIAKRKLIVDAMDRRMIPVIGTKHITEAEVAKRDAIEKLWRDCPNKTLEDRTKRAEYRKQYMLLRQGIAIRNKLAPDCIGEAAINYSSSAQLRNALWKMGYSKKQLPDTDDRSLEKLSKFPSLTIDKVFKVDECAPEELTSKQVAKLATLPMIDLVRLFRSVEKSITTYGEQWTITYGEKDEAGNSGLVSPFTGRIHSNISQFGAATGRTSSSKPNIQNIPKGSAYRHSFVARPVYHILTVDYSGCELRIMAELSGEQIWLEAFKKDWDVHSVGAEILFGKRWAEGAIAGCKYLASHQKCKCPIHEELRGQVKAINFGLAYGMAAQKLSEELNITKTEAEALLALYFKTFPTVTKYLETSGKNAKDNLEQRTICGRRRRWKKPTWEKAKENAVLDAKDRAKANGTKELSPSSRDISWKFRQLIGNIEREGKNSPIQGANADLAKRAMYLLWLELFPRFGAFFVNMVHDELVIECPEQCAEECFKWVGDTMTKAGEDFLKLIPFTTEGSNETYWNK